MELQILKRKESINEDSISQESESDILKEDSDEDIDEEQDFDNDQIIKDGAIGKKILEEFLSYLL